MGGKEEANRQQRLQRAEYVSNRSLRGFTLQSLEIQQLDDRDKDLVLIIYKSLSGTMPRYMVR